MLAVLLVALHAPAFPARADTPSGLEYFRQGAFAEAQQAWRAAAAAGDRTAALFIGVSYDVGEGVPADGANAALWYKTAADLGSRVAMFNLAVLYDKGLGVARDPTAAASWYGHAAALGYARAEYNLGLMYEGDAGIPPDRKRAIHWFQHAMRDGISAAKGHLMTLGVSAQALGPGQAEDPGIQAFQAAQVALLSRQPDEVKRAALLFRDAAEHNNPLAAYDLGYCYENAIGVPEDLAQAHHWYLRAVDLAGDDGLRSLASASAERLGRRLAPPSPRPGPSSTIPSTENPAGGRKSASSRLDAPASPPAASGKSAAGLVGPDRG